MKFLDRRTMLRGLVGGATVALSLPILESMLDSKGEAFANNVSLPRRYGVWFFAGGVHQNWAPTSTGVLNLGSPFQPLTPFASKLTFVGGLTCPTFGNYAENRHLIGTTGGLSGHKPSGGAFTAKSFDQIVADKLGSDGIHSLQVGVYTFGTSETGTAWDWISHSGPNSPNPAEFVPGNAYDYLFGALQTPEAGGIDKNALRAKYLDAVLEDSKSLKGRLGSVDRTKVDSFMEGLFELQKQVTSTAGVGVAACIPPEEAKILGGQEFEATNRAMAKIVAMALACRLTNVFAFQYTGPNAFVQYPGLPDSHHNMGHNNPQHSRIGESTAYTMTQFAALLEEMDSIDEGAGTLLDNSGVLVQSDVAWDHTMSDMVAIVAGRAGGALAGGKQVVTTGPTTRLALTVARAVGADLGSLGEEDGYSEGSIDEMLA